MNSTIRPGKTPELWNADALLTKAHRYVQRMLEEREIDWEYALWAGLSLELLARAALANVSPALLADPENWNHLYSSLGFEPTESKVAPKSIQISEVTKRLGTIFPSFNKEVQSACTILFGHRNAELHSGETPFNGVARSSWQPGFFRAAEVLLETMDYRLDDFFGDEEADAARKLIAAAADEGAKAVRGDVAAHQKVWSAKEDNERGLLLTAARSFATRSAGHRVKCPACECPALVNGEPIAPSKQILQGGLIIETQEYLPTHFECVACGLKIHGLSRLSVVGLGDRYINTQTYDAAEYFSPEDETPEYDDDNNEYYSPRGG